MLIDVKVVDETNANPLDLTEKTNFDSGNMNQTTTSAIPQALEKEGNRSNFPIETKCVLYSLEAAQLCSKLGILTELAKPEYGVGPNPFADEMFQPPNPVIVRLDSLPSTLSSLKSAISVANGILHGAEALERGKQIRENCARAVDVPDSSWRLAGVMIVLGNLLVRPYPETENEYSMQAFANFMTQLEKFKETTGDTASLKSEARINTDIINSLFDPPILKNTKIGEDIRQFLGLFDNVAMLRTSQSDAIHFPFVVGSGKGHDGELDESDLKAFRGFVNRWPDKVRIVEVPEAQMKAAALKLKSLCFNCPLAKLFNVHYPKIFLEHDYDNFLPNVEKRKQLVLLHHLLSLERVVKYNIILNNPMENVPLPPFV